MVGCPAILTANVGSSSLKLSVHEENPPRVYRGSFDHLGSGTSNWSLDLPDHEKIEGSGSLSSAVDSLPTIRDWLKKLRATPIAVAHRIVHGGPELRDHCLITAQVKSQLQETVPLAPEHLPAELGLLESLQRELPEIPHIACLDTAFHRHLPPVAHTLPLPQALAREGVRRYGFHGLSYEHLVDWLKKKGCLEGKTLLAHLGNGSSMAAVLDGVCLDTTMGFTPAAGLVMGSRCGDIDPGLFRYLATHRKMDALQIDHLLNHQSGMLGISGLSGDVRDLSKKAGSVPEAALALEVFAHAARKHLCALTGSLEGLDRIVFTGGIGKHSPLLRKKILQGLEFLGIELDSSANDQTFELISSDNSKVRIHVVPADEEQSMVHIARRLLPQSA